MSTKGPLDGLKVLDLSRILAGPLATQTLADLGAEVIKVESFSGDDTRKWGPPFIGGDEKNDAAYFTACNRNKKSIAVDFSKPAGQKIVKDIAERSDVLVENFKPKTLDKYGLGYDAISKINKKIVYCSVTGFGQYGPYSHRAGYDFLIQGMSGLMSITGAPDHQPGGGPMKVGVAVSDLFTGMYADLAIMAAVMHAKNTGQGQHLDCSLLDCQISMLANQGSNWLVGKSRPSRLGNNHPNVVPYSVYPASDGYVIIACGNDAQFIRLCNALSLSPCEDFATNAKRVMYRNEVDEMISSETVKHLKKGLISKLEGAGVPCGPINEIPEVFEDEHVKARGMVVEMQSSDYFGAVQPTVAFPVKMSVTPAVYRHAPPALGKDTDAVINSILGYSEEEVASLRKSGVIR